MKIPSEFVCTPPNMLRKYQDTVRVCQSAGHPKRTPTTWHSLALELQIKIMFFVAINSIKDWTTVITVQKRFNKIHLEQGFYAKIKFAAIPRRPWKIPRSVEQDFLTECQKANNPEYFFRQLVGDIFVHRDFSRLNNLIDMVIRGGHELGPYVAIVFRLLSNYDEHRNVGMRLLADIRNKACGTWDLEGWRITMLFFLQRHHENFIFKHCGSIRRYCANHYVPHHRDRLNDIECKACMADLEVYFYVHPLYYKAVTTGN